ncbi:GNAT family N-acetyltransferase [Kaustia mangrovi]|uniref:GNAT family N-acetyltransferase n=1 Tax=Kaustia mangrovi TaxID=2593653 RepID=A0A7S8HE32_9HYPH|nr:GNAT family protein [Kaustia mangrovi]QPC45104.1 GNAT family N-acetyltransferase [Kaustia mangrovi]
MITHLSSDALVLETERLRLAPMTMADEDIARALLCDPRVMRYVTDVMTPEAVRDHMAEATRRGAGGRIGIWCAFRKDTGEKIGDGVLTPVPIDGRDTDWSQVVPDAYPADQIEVGYLLVPSAWGQGFATEICARLLQFAFEETSLSEVVATTDPDNRKSQHVLTKCGMRALGVKRAYGDDNAQWFAMTRPEWEARGTPS